MLEDIGPQNEVGHGELAKFVQVIVEGDLFQAWRCQVSKRWKGPTVTPQRESVAHGCRQLLQALQSIENTEKSQKICVFK